MIGFSSTITIFYAVLGKLLRHSDICVLRFAGFISYVLQNPFAIPISRGFST